MRRLQRQRHERPDEPGDRLAGSLMRRTVALLVFGVLAIGAAPAHAATLTSVKFRAPVLTTRWALDSGDCAGALALSGRRAVDDYGFFTGWTVVWGGADCLATSNSRTLGKRNGVYRLQGRALAPGTCQILAT